MKRKIFTLVKGFILRMMILDIYLVYYLLDRFLLSFVYLFAFGEGREDRTYHIHIYTIYTK